MSEFKLPDQPALSAINELPDHETLWAEAANSSNLGITPFAAKVYYTIGLLRHAMEAAGWVLARERQFGGTFYLAAYLQTSAAVELLGRCLLGDSRLVNGSRDRLLRGIQDIAGLPNDNLETTIGSTGYTIRHCTALRNLAAHGAAATKGPVLFDPHFVLQILRMLADGVDRYGNRLQDPMDQDARENLSKAAIMPLFAGGNGAIRPILINDVHEHLNNGGSVASALLHSDVWRG